MNKDEFQKRLKVLYRTARNSGNNYAHREADDLLVETLESLGYDLTEYKDSERWFS